MTSLSTTSVKEQALLSVDVWVNERADVQLVSLAKGT